MRAQSPRGVHHSWAVRREVYSGGARGAYPEDLAEANAFLTSSDFVTGQTFRARRWRRDDVTSAIEDFDSSIDRAVLSAAERAVTWGET